MNAKLIWLAYCIATLAASVDAADITNRSVPAAIITERLRFRLSASGVYTNVFSAEQQVHYHILPTPEGSEVLFRRFPAEEAFEFTLSDSEGRTVPKTQLGEALSGTVRVPSNLAQAASLKGSTLPLADSLFRPSEVFMITNKGTYTLQVRLRLWAEGGKAGGRDIEPWMANPAFVKKFVGNTNAQFGLVVSESLEATVVK